jgi:nucleotide-binding universal stress UspA family protein
VVEEVLGDRPGVQVIPRTIRGGAAQVLVDASRHAELLVVGSLGLGGLKGMMLGSTGHHCAAHSHCPVVIVHHEHKPVHQPRREVGKAHATA